MGISNAIELAAPELRQRGIAPPVLVQRGTSVAPAILKFSVGSKPPFHVEMWEGSAYGDEKIAECILEEALCAHWDAPVKEVRALLQHERSQAQR